MILAGMVDRSLIRSWPDSGPWLFLLAKSAAALALLVVIPSVTRADEIFLKNGNKITGQVVRESPREVVYYRADGEYTLPRSIVDRIERTSASAADSLAATHAREAESKPAAPMPVLQPLNTSGEPSGLAVRNGSLDESQLGRLDSDVLRNPSDENRYRLALAYREAGAFLTHSGHPDRAIELYRHALNYAPSDLGLTVALGYTLVTQKKFNQAIELLVPASDQFPQSADVPLLLGSAYYYTENLDRAVAEWKRSLELNDDPRVRDALARAEHERDVAASYQEIRGLHFLVRYQGSATQPLADQVLKTLEADFRDLQQDLDVYPHETIIVLLYPDQTFKDITRLPSWVGAENDGKIRIPVSGLSSVTPDLERVLRHELTHSFVYQATYGHCPTWFNEGLAQLEEGSTTATSGTVLARALLNGQTLSFEDLENSFFDLPRDQVGMAYSKSLAALQYLRDTFGMAEIRRMLKLIATSPDFNSVLQNELRMNYPAFEQNVAAYIEKRYGS
jgi:tetratricopeptide (TPR) repeat protein